MHSRVTRTRHAIRSRASVNLWVDGMSRKFRSAENFGPGPIFSENFGPVGPILSEKKGPCPEKKVRRFISYVHVVDISLRVMAEIEETAAVDDGSDCDHTLLSVL